MILSEDQIKDIILTNPGKDLIRTGVEYTKKLRMHFYGDKLDLELKTIDGFEKDSLHKLRVKYTSSNKDLFCRLSRPLDKVFSAKGGSVYYNLQEGMEKKARELASDIRGGYSLKSWIENFWKPHNLDDPNGLIFMEIYPIHTVMRLRAQEKPFVYPTYKSITSVYDYLPNGARLEYVVFRVNAQEKKAAGLQEVDTIYRVVDDAFDYYVKHDGKDVLILKDHTLPNYFMQVPGMLNSDIANPNMDGNMLSFFDEVLELANHYLLKGSIKVTHDFMHGFAKYWEYADDCSACNGAGVRDADPCKDCRGTGKRIMTKVSDVKLLAHPQTKEDQLIAPNVGGYIEPSKTYWEIATADLEMLEELMSYTLWGSNAISKTQGMRTEKNGNQKTATEVMSDIKPQSDRLHQVTESAEKRHKFILDSMIRIQLNQNYTGSSVNYGKRYMLEGPDVLWEKYSKARAAGAAASVLDDLLLEYYEAKYDSDPVKLAIQIKLMKVEPFVHHTTAEIKALMPAEEDYKSKLYFSEWLSTLNDAMILSFSIDDLRSNLNETIALKQLPKSDNILSAA